jgi:hypothetical protein
MNLGNAAQSGIEFAAHILMATLVLIVVATGAVGLGYFLFWVEAVPYTVVPSFVAKTLRVVEDGLFILDIATYCLYVGTMAISFLKALLRSMRETGADGRAAK